MKKSHLSKIIFAFVIILLIIILSLTIFKNLKNKKINENAQFLYNNITNIKKEKKELITGQYYDFQTTQLNYDGKKPNEGIIFIDEDNSFHILSNIKIDNMYCIYLNDKFDCSDKYNKSSNIENYSLNQEYKIGQAVKLIDGSKWHVINDSSEYSKYVTLISDERVDINKDGFVFDNGSTENPDRISFDSAGSKKYDPTSSTNIGYYLENTYRETLNNLKNILEIRLLTSEELDAIKEKINFDELTDSQIKEMSQAEEEVMGFLMEDNPRPYEKLKDVKVTEEQYNKLMPHWLFNAASSNWWLMPSDNQTITAVWNGDGTAQSGTKSKYSLKPVITLSKENIVNN